MPRPSFSSVQNNGRADGSVAGFTGLVNTAACLHIAKQGEGPLIALAQDWLELWYSWRHILPALTAAGYHAVAPYMRGYGQTDAPPDIQDYIQFQLVGDVWLGWCRPSDTNRW